MRKITVDSYPCNITNSSFEKVPTHQGLWWPSVWSLALPDSVVHIPPKVQDVLKVSNNTFVKSFYVNVWQKPLQYCKVISLQLIKINEKTNKQTNKKELL